MMTIDKVTAIRNFLNYYTASTAKSSSSGTDSFKELLNTVIGDTVSISQKKSTAIEDDNLRFITERLKYSTLSGGKKESLLKQVWNMARTSLASGESDSAKIDDKTAGEVLKMVSVMEFLDQTQSTQTFNDYLSDSKNLNQSISSLLDEDEKYSSLNQKIQALQTKPINTAGTVTEADSETVISDANSAIDITI